MFTLSDRSRDNLVGVHQDLVLVVRLAIELTEVDFGVTEGLRDSERQGELVKAGASRTGNSRHLWGKAVDTVAYVGPTPRWDWPLYPKIAEAFQRAAVQMHVAIRWGGVWDRRLNEIEYDLDDAHNEYVLRWRRLHPGQKGPLVDGPHFELDRGVYPDQEIVTT